MALLSPGALPPRPLLVLVGRLGEEVVTYCTQGVILSTHPLATKYSNLWQIQDSNQPQQPSHNQQRCDAGREVGVHRLATMDFRLRRLEKELHCERENFVT